MLCETDVAPWCDKWELTAWSTYSAVLIMIQPDRNGEEMVQNGQEWSKMVKEDGMK